jgi:hypothetical protein
MPIPMLEEIGIEFRDDAEALALWREAGADVKGERVRFPKGLCRELLKTAPEVFTQHARNPARSVQIGGKATVFAPVYGPPFVRDLDGERRYATIEDFRNFVKLAYMAPSLHHSGGTVCEPVDVPVNKRHFDMVYSHMKYSDKPFMGSVTAPERAEDTIEMCKILFGAEFVDQNCVTLNLINANSPMVFDETMVGALKVYARNNQACVVSPFILAGAMSPVTVAGTLTQILAEVLAGCVHAADPARRAGALRHLRRLDFDAVGCADLRNPGAGAGVLRCCAAGAAAEDSVPHRRIAVRLEGAGCAGCTRERLDAEHDASGGHQFRAAFGRMAGRRACQLLREVHDRCRSARHAAALRRRH